MMTMHGNKIRDKREKRVQGDEKQKLISDPWPCGRCRVKADLLALF